jgi:hypothetical protein
VGAFVDSDARERIPLAEQNAIADVPLGVDDIESRAAGPLAGDRHEQNDDRNGGDAAAARDRREQDGGGGRQRRGGQYDARRAEAIEQRNQDQATARRADEIGGVDGVDLRRHPRNRHRDDEAAGERRERRRACRSSASALELEGE